MADLYRSLVVNLRDKLGGTINDANADAIARAAAQVYRREVEPRLWEEKSAHELLDSFGVPRSGAFIPYSLSDRLLLLHRSHGDDPHRAQAHELLDELGVPHLDEVGHLRPLENRLTLLLGSLDDAPASAAQSGSATETDEALSGAHPEPAEARPEVAADPHSADGTVASPELVDALETIKRAVGPAGDDETIPAPPPLPPGPSAAADLLGLGTVLGTISERLVEIEHAVESLRQELREAVALFQGGGGPTPVAPVPGDVGSADAVPEVVVRRDGVPSEEGTPPVVGASDEPQSGPSHSAALDMAPVSPGVEGSYPVSETATGGPVSRHEPTRVLPPVAAVPPDAPAFSEEAVAVDVDIPRHRARRLVLLVVLVVLIGVLLAAGVTAAVVLGWDQLESRIVDFVSVPLWDGRTTASW